MVFTSTATLKPLAPRPVEIATLSRIGTPSPIAAYFTALNTQDYAVAASCFAPTGQLIPPFETAIIGPGAIARYLRKEASGMTFKIEAVQSQGENHYYLRGKARSPWFNLSVAWDIDLNAQGAIAQLQIHLLAKPEELLMLRPD